jgi:hypothetical protein
VAGELRAGGAGVVDSVGQVLLEALAVDGGDADEAEEGAADALEGDVAHGAPVFFESVVGDLPHECACTALVVAAQEDDAEVGAEDERAVDDDGPDAHEVLLGEGVDGALCDELDALSGVEEAIEARLDAPEHDDALLDVAGGAHGTGLGEDGGEVAAVEAGE